MIEYWLQKKTLGGWSAVTWYSELAQAEENYQRCLKTGVGYSWRLVEVKVLKEERLQEETKIEAPEIQEPNTKPNWFNPNAKDHQGNRLEDKWTRTSQPAADALKPSWGSGAATWGEKPAVINPSQSDLSQHGLAGSVWLVHHGLKKKTRVPAIEAEALIAQGYERGSPRTVFRE